MKNVVRIKFGSHLYGTNTPESDEDYIGVHIPDSKDILLQQVPETVIFAKPEKTGEGQKNKPGDKDDKSYSLQRFFRLCAEGQTVAIDMLFAPPENIIESSFMWTQIQENRHRLLTKKSTAFLGYCRQQANKYGIKGSRVDAARAASEAFISAMAYHGATSKVGDFSTLLANLHKDYSEHIGYESKTNKNTGQTEQYFVCCNRMVPFTASVKLAAEIYTKIYENYGDRARKAQLNEGVDWKALSHAVRVGYEAVELLKTGKVTLPLPEAWKLKHIKQGLIPYELVSEEIEQLLEKVEMAALDSDLPDEVDHKFIEIVTKGIYADAVCNEFQEGTL